MGQIQDIKGIRVGHFSDFEGRTGCTVVLCEKGAIAGVDVRGSAPGTRETALLNPLCTVDRVHAILLSGGSAFGLDAATGVMRYLEERGFGFDVGVAKVPIVPSAVLFDLAVGNPSARPDSRMGYDACLNAETNPMIYGKIGAGTGATVGKLYGMEFAMDSGVSSESLLLDDGVIVAAIVAVNAVGDVINSKTGEIIGGAYDSKSNRYLDCSALLLNHLKKEPLDFSTNTTIGVIATNACLSKTQATKVAQMAHNGYAKSLRPVHTSMDGDTIFALSYGEKVASVDTIGFAAAEVMSRAIEKLFLKP